MELTVYRQAFKERPDGTIVYKGEDALPLVNDRLLLVADGLGGAAAIRHQNIRPELFDPALLPKVLFGQQYGGDMPPAFETYIRDSFFELFAVRDCYTDNVNNIKKSGYFASRIVAGIFLHIFLYNDPPFDCPGWIDHLSALPAEERRAQLQKAEEHLTSEVVEGLKLVAERAGLTYESAYSGLALLGTTLCLTLYRETEDGVRAVYLTAGDSRPYVWEESKGLRQLLPDEEGPDGGMTNYIRANNTEGIRIRCDFMTFKKPCILFNASDGCFDSKQFLSPMAFEKLLLDTAVISKSEKEMGERLTDFFKEHGRHDDSSTMAMKFFGYDSFESLQESAKKRLEALQEKYLEKMPDLLEYDYATGISLKPEEEKPAVPEGTAEPSPADETVLQLKRSLQEALFENYLHDYIAFPDRYVSED